jgi:hypothetical protein
MVDWASARAFTEQACAEIFDYKVFTATGMRKPARDVNASAAPDPDRPAFDFMGSVDSEPSFNQIGSSARTSASSFGDRQVARTCITALARDWPWMIQQGDTIVGAEQQYRVVATPDRDGSERVAIWVNKV